MDEAQREVERIVMRIAESARWDVPAEAAPRVAGRLREALGSSIGTARFRIADGVPVVRVPARTRRGARWTLTVGADVLVQAFHWSIEGLPWNQEAVDSLSSIEKVLKADVDVLRSMVKDAKEALLSDPVKVEETRAIVRARREKEAKAARENLVLSFLELFKSGWTRDQLVEAVDEAVCRSVMTS